MSDNPSTPAPGFKPGVLLTKAQFQRLADIVLFKHRLFIKYLTDLGPGKISLTQFIMLDQLATHGLFNMGQLAQIMRHTTPATTGIVDRLIVAGLVERTTNPNDRRQIVIRPTKKGLEVVRVMRERLVIFLSDVAREMTAEEQQAWIQTNETVYRIETKDSHARSALVVETETAASVLENEIAEF